MFFVVFYRRDFNFFSFEVVHALDKDSFGCAPYAAPMTYLCSTWVVAVLGYLCFVLVLVLSFLSFVYSVILVFETLLMRSIRSFRLSCSCPRHVFPSLMYALSWSLQTPPLCLAHEFCHDTFSITTKIHSSVFFFTSFI